MWATLGSKAHGSIVPHPILLHLCNMHTAHNTASTTYVLEKCSDYTPEKSGPWSMHCLNALVCRPPTTPCTAMWFWLQHVHRTGKWKTPPVRGLLPSHDRRGYEIAPRKICCMHTFAVSQVVSALKWQKPWQLGKKLTPSHPFFLCRV